jgi:hypothetical protein
MKWKFSIYSFAVFDRFYSQVSRKKENLRCTNTDVMNHTQFLHFLSNRLSNLKMQSIPK